jgi:ppGpp synthetase/RelA/SpoT-type nucleotidyltranferase
MSTSSLTPHRPRSLKRRLATTTVAFVATSAYYFVIPVSSFGSTTTPTAVFTSMGQPAITSQVFYTFDQNMEHHTSDFFNPLFLHQPQHLSQQFLPEQDFLENREAFPSHDMPAMPAWLRVNKSHLVQENMVKLRDAMLLSFFTETEVLKLTYAIQEASNGNASKMAGAAEFCLIMVETMEMGLSALVAAAFHYCSCVDAREQSLFPQNGSNNDAGSLAPWEFRPHQGIGSFGEHAMQLERDAARLKRLEVVASMVLHNSHHSHRVTPDRNAADNLRNLYTTEAKDWRALAIRGAACLYRLRGIVQITGPGDKLTKESNRACREALRIYAPLASRLGMHRLKNELEQAAFQILYKRQHRTVESLLRQTRSPESVRFFYHSRGSASLSMQRDIDNEVPDIEESMQQILALVQSEVNEILENDAVFSSSVTGFSVTARVKEGYSTWKKMLRNGFDHILQVPDALALRIVLDAKKDHDHESDAVTRARERALCYYVQQLCMTVWKPNKDNPRFKDYIANPKENGYQSLHYTASTPWRGEEWNMEIQVRSGEMHKVAEFGIASHWNYKATARPAKGNGINAASFGMQESSTIAFVDEMPGDLEHVGKVLAQHNSDAYLRSLQEWHWQQHGSPVDPEPLVLFDEAESRERAERIRARTQRLAPYIEALTNEQSDLQRNSVFVFLAPQSASSSGDKEEMLAKGSVVALPAGAVVLDAVRKCAFPEADIAVQVMTHNGEPARLFSRLQNGDVLTIPAVTVSVNAV